VLHLIRNLAFTKYLPVQAHLSADQAGFSGLQTRLVRVLEETHVIQLLPSFLEFFLAVRVKGKANRGQGGEGEEWWGFGLIAELTETSWIVWVLKRMREAVEEKPKAWTELQADIECLTQLLLLIDMSSSGIGDPVLREAGVVLDTVPSVNQKW